MKRLFLIFAYPAAVALPAFAQLSPPLPAPPAPGALDAARELVTTLGIDKQSITPLIPMIEALARRLHLNEADTSELKSIYQEWFTQDLDKEKLQTALIQLYAQSFTADELQQIITFYNTPVGHKLLVTTPILTQKSSQVGLEEIRVKQSQLQKRLEPFMEKHRPTTPPTPSPSSTATPASPAPPTSPETK